MEAILTAEDPALRGRRGVDEASAGRQGRNPLLARSSDCS